MLVFTDLGALDVLRAVVALGLAGVLPGLLLYARRKKASSLWHAFDGDFFEAVAVSVLLSFVILGFASMLLVFTIGFSFAAIAVLEALAIAGCWWAWKKLG